MTTKLINYELTCQPLDDGHRFWPDYHHLMVDKLQTLGDRFLVLKKRSGLSYQALATAIFERTGHSISPQALHKWVKGGQADEESVIAVCSYFDVHPAWLRYGISDGPPDVADQQAKGEVLSALPPEPQQQVLDFVRYKFEGSTAWFTGEKITHYLKMIEGFQRDLSARKERDRRSGPDDFSGDKPAG